MNAQLAERPTPLADTRAAAWNLAAALRLHDLPLIQRAAHLRRASRAAGLGAIRVQAHAEHSADRQAIRAARHHSAGMREQAARLAARAQAARDLANA